MDIVVISDGNRPKLLTQTLNTLTRNSCGGPINLHLELSQGRGVGETKNAGALQIQRTSDYLVFSDDDMYWLEDWDRHMEAVMRSALIMQLGAWSHPYNIVTDCEGDFFGYYYGKVHAVHGGGFMIRWDDWDAYGGFLANAKGPGQSEDWELSQRLAKAGGRVQCIQPFVALHCGITNCEGKPATGADAIREQLDQLMLSWRLKGVHYE